MHYGRLVSLVACVVAVLYAVPARPAAEGQAAYTFTKIIDDDSTVFPSMANVHPSNMALNNEGLVVFGGGFDNDFWFYDGVIRHGGRGSAVALNDLGHVAYIPAAPGPSALALQTGAATTLLLAANDFPGISGYPMSLNNAGQVAFGGPIVFGSEGVFIASPAGLQPLSWYGPFAGQPSATLFGYYPGEINESGTMVWLASRNVANAVRRGIYRGSETPLVEDGALGGRLFVDGVPRINDAGTVAFSAGLDGRPTLLTTDDGVAFREWGIPQGPQTYSLNNHGVVAYSGRPNAEAPFGLYTGPDPNRDRVIVAGDSLLGRVLITAQLPQAGFNDRGQLLFMAFARDSDGRNIWGLYLATPTGTADASAPVITAPAEVVATTPSGGANVTFAVTAVDDVDPAPVVTCTPASGSFFPVGPSHVNCTARDANGNESFATISVRVVLDADTAPPVISGVTPSQIVLSPPNHRMVPIAIAVEASDASGPVSCSVVSVFSNEPVDGRGDGHTGADWRITGPLMVELRAERSGSGAGRIYTVAVSCRDAAGNAAVSQTTVTVPRDRR